MPFVIDLSKLVKCLNAFVSFSEYHRIGENKLDFDFS